MDKRKIDEFWSTRTTVSDPRLATNYRDDGRLAFDVALVNQYLSRTSRILDLGAGTCTMSHALLGHDRKIDAVEKFGAFLKKAPDNPNLNKIESDIVVFEPSNKYDVILIFGVINFLTRDEEASLYKRCAASLNPGGTLIVKNQCGIHVEKIVDTFSNELSASYHARYPSVADQKHLLQTCFSVEVVDIYPDPLNRWTDTHFYAFVCKQPL